MTRALVVDDSKLARIALQRQLEDYSLEVELADSGEQALDFLKRDTVDVIFMDHVMPGMDGLSAVRALKSNPRTATIPVMMYTTKEGELYVSQARALGAVEVLPKTVQPGVLYGMLLKLGLVEDRRQSNPRPKAEQAAVPEAQPAAAPADHSTTVPDLASLIGDVLEDQRSAMRSDLMSAQRSFARQVAGEVQERQQAEFEALRATLENRMPTLALPMIAGGLAIATVLFAALYLNAGSVERDASQAAVPTVSQQPASAEVRPAAAPTIPATSEAGPMEIMAPVAYAIAWALNESGEVPFDGAPFDAARGEQIVTLLDQLEAAGFRGTVRVEAHLGEFCLAVDDNGVYGPAAPGTPLSGCALIGHPLDASESLAERQTPEFAALMERAVPASRRNIEVELVANDRSASLPLVPYPVDAANAGAWNAAAARNHRVEYQLLPELL